MIRSALLSLLPAALFAAEPLYFPPPGEALSVQSRRTPEQAGFAPDVALALAGVGERWALWRHGHLIHVQGDWNALTQVNSHRKTWHAMAVGAATQQEKIASVRQPMSVWNPELTGPRAAITWRDVLTQSAGLDYPYGQFPAYPPGRMWTYSDLNLVQLCNALARVYGRRDFRDRYDLVLREAYFEAIGMNGWKATVQDDGVRLHVDLEDMGRLGLLALARGNWNGRQLVPRRFVEELESKQTKGMLVNYNGPNDGTIPFDPAQFPEAPYGYLTWNNNDRRSFPGAHPAWAWATGKGGHQTYWNRELGIVFGVFGATKREPGQGIPELIEASLPRARTSR